MRDTLDSPFEGSDGLGSCEESLQLHVANIGAYGGVPLRSASERTLGIVSSPLLKAGYETPEGLLRSFFVAVLNAPGG